MARTERLDIRVSPQDRELLALLAQGLQLSESECLRQALYSWAGGLPAGTGGARLAGARDEAFRRRVREALHYEPSRQNPEV